MNNDGSKRSRLLTSASDIVREKGVSKLTLEAVANQAGVSKGGLLYYFPSKEALIKAMIDEMLDVYVNDIQKNLQDIKGRGQWTRAYMKSMFMEVEDGLKISSALLASMFTNPELLDKAQTRYKEFQEKVENDQADPIHSTIARLAADGLWFAEMFGLAPLDKKMRDKVYDELTNLITKGDE
ncbi:transcriptional regulator, TetR family [Marininema mesophilum]|uniref:Transcriptional regulator, TetR family n=1 Tax=Marininema mesophilum TaxID=1048340 RepID=A0A1H3AAE8_9BACL|nr:TetR family transcriptional regulator [Marininema mesophilum]SDX26535.1 transcriptional regulator, TetR family [Marininema mesophilum]